MKMSVLDWIALILVIVGGLNWGLVGIFSFDLVAAIFGHVDHLTHHIHTRRPCRDLHDSLEGEAEEVTLISSSGTGIHFYAFLCRRSPFP